MPGRDGVCGKAGQGQGLGQGRQAASHQRGDKESSVKTPECKHTHTHALRARPAAGARGRPGAPAAPHCNCIVARPKVPERSRAAKSAYRPNLAHYGRTGLSLSATRTRREVGEAACGGADKHTRARHGAEQITNENPQPCQAKQSRASSAPCPPAMCAARPSVPPRRAFRFPHGHAVRRVPGLSISAPAFAFTPPPPPR